MLRLLHISDTHLAAEPDAVVSGWRTQASLDTVLEDAMDRLGRIDGMLVSGDLVDDGSASGYERLAGQLAARGIPICLLPGNHDNPAAMRNSMARPGLQVLKRTVVGAWQILPLNSHVPGEEYGRVGEAQLQALDGQLSRHSQPALVTVHHPPMEVGSAWLDAMRLEDGGALLRTCARHTHARAVVFGHVHQAFAAEYRHLKLWATPATCRQFLPHSTRFAEDDAAPGYRCLLLADDGGVESRLYRVPRARTLATARDHGSENPVSHT